MSIDITAHIESAVKLALSEDLGMMGDITSNALIPTSLQATAKFTARKDGVLCGMPCVLTTLRLVDPALHIEVFKKDGEPLKQGDVIATMTGSARSILTAERTALNFLTHLSGISTLAAQFVAKVTGTHANILCTRKTIPGMRALEKYAVRMGGALNHRFGLYDAVLIKDNHLATLGSITRAVEAARMAVGRTIKIEVEVDTLSQLDEALTTDADVIMLDNFSLENLRTAVAKTAGRIVLDASGGCDPANYSFHCRNRR
jgi:nicotinate-nucleotide pyrophosphorylase (carboxylating)